MARPRGFDPEAVVGTAMMLFWERGYDSVSFDRLVHQTGASRKGLYALWPDKRALLVAALRRYRLEAGDHFLRDMERSEAGLGDVAGFWRKFESAAREPPWRGCLIMRMASDEIAAEPDVAAEIRAHLDRLSDAFEHALSGAERRSELTSNVPAGARARQGFAIAVACATLGVFEGFTPRIAGLIEAGRAACGVSACQDS